MAKPAIYIPVLNAAAIGEPSAVRSDFPAQGRIGNAKATTHPLVVDSERSESPAAGMAAKDGSLISTAIPPLFSLGPTGVEPVTSTMSRQSPPRPTVFFFSFLKHMRPRWE